MLFESVGAISSKLTYFDRRKEGGILNLHPMSRLVSDKLRWSGGVKLGLGMAFLRCLENIHKNMKSVSTPFLIIHGDNDSLCQPAGSHLLMREASCKDKKIKIYQGASHHLILEVRVKNNFFQWLS